MKPCHKRKHVLEVPNLQPCKNWTVRTPWNYAFASRTLMGFRGGCGISRLCIRRARGPQRRDFILESSFEGKVERWAVTWHQEFLSNENIFNREKTEGNAVGFPGSTTHSFELPTTDVTMQVHPSVKVMSAASIAAIGDWCTLGPKEWGGGESIAKHTSGRNLSIFANKSHGGTLFDLATLEDLYDFLTVEETRRSSGNTLRSTCSTICRCLGTR